MRALSLTICVLAAASMYAQGSAGPCDVLPADDPWNVDISQYPVHPLSPMFIESIDLGSTSKRLHPDFGTNPEYGIPYVFVSSTQPLVPITYNAYGNESDPGPFPVPADAPVEGGAQADGDRHVIVVDTSSCMLYELFSSYKDESGSGWTVQSGAVFNLTRSEYRQDGWTSADAAGLPIFPGLVRYEEVSAGAINHAVRFTSRYSQRGWIHPARHQAGRPDTTYPPMGLRLRLRDDYDISAITGQARVIVQALRKYGMILADNGTSWFISGTSDSRWDLDDLNQLKRIPGAAFEAVYTGPIKRTPDVSGVDDFAVSAEAQSLSVIVAGDVIDATFSLSSESHASIALVNIRGEIVSTILDGTRDAGANVVRTDVSALESGVYFCRLTTSMGTSVARVVLVR